MHMNNKYLQKWYLYVLMYFTMNYRPRQFCTIVCTNIKFTLMTTSHMKYTSNTHPSLDMFPSPHWLSRHSLTKPLSPVSVATGGEGYYTGLSCNTMSLMVMFSRTISETAQAHTFFRVRLQRHTYHTPCMLTGIRVTFALWSLSTVLHRYFSLFSVLLV